MSALPENSRESLKLASLNNVEDDQHNIARIVIGRSNLRLRDARLKPRVPEWFTDKLVSGLDDH